MLDKKSIYNIAFNVIDYCGNIAKGNSNYSEYFSPNNIRRLIISPDVVRAEFYISVPNIGLMKQVNIPSSMLQQLEYMEGYVPIVQIIATERICSSIEEIVFLINSNDGQTRLGPQEYDFASLVTSYNRRSGDLLDTIKKRYVRLRYITIANISMNQFMSLKRDKSTVIGELSPMQGVSEIKKIHDEEDWYKHWGNPAAAKTYPTMDAVGGHLHNFFQDYIKKVVALEKQKSIDDYKSKRYDADKKRFETELKRFEVIVKLRNRLRKVINEHGYISGVSKGLNFLDVPELIEYPDMKPYPSVKPKGNMNLGEVYKFNEEAIKTYTKEFVRVFATSFILMLHEFMTQYPVTFRTMTHGAETTVVVPNEVLTQASELSRQGYTLDGTSIMASVVNICYLTCLFFVEKASPKFSPSFITRSFWEGVIK